MSKSKLKLATAKDAETVKDLINKMYRSEYEIRDIEKISQAIEEKTEIYILAYKDDACFGFSGASINNDYYKDIISPDIAVIDYIYTCENSRDVIASFELISELLKTLAKMGVKQAIMQVQTYNKQRFFHYALSNKNIIKTTPIEANGKMYEDQILLIEDVNEVSKISIRELMKIAHKYSVEDKLLNSKI